jgi:hypothetical protein
MHKCISYVRVVPKSTNFSVNYTRIHRSRDRPGTSVLMPQAVIILSKSNLGFVGPTEGF